MDQDEAGRTREGSTPGRVRASDAERDRVVQQLRDHHEAGRLTVEEFTDRMDAALAARYRDELPPLLADLPDDGPKPDAGDPRERRHGRHWPPGPRVPLVPVLAVFAVAASIGAVTHGAFPWPVLGLVLLAWWIRRRVV